MPQACLRVRPWRSRDHGERICTGKARDLKGRPFARDDESALDSRMATEVELIDAEALQTRVRELRRFL
jgi:hypothetical protein